MERPRAVLPRGVPGTTAPRRYRDDSPGLSFCPRSGCARGPGGPSPEGGGAPQSVRGANRSPAPPDIHLLLKTDRSEIGIGVVERPTWAQRMGRDPYGLFVDVTIEPLKKSRFEVPFSMRWIAPGRFMMGSPEEEAGRDDDEQLHEVTLTEGFWMAETPCTQDVWTAIMEKNPSEFVSPERPVDSVSYEDVQQFLARFQERQRGLALRLPTEAQWEYACRAGTTDATYAGPMDHLG